MKAAKGQIQVYVVELHRLTRAPCCREGLRLRCTERSISKSGDQGPEEPGATTTRNPTKGILRFGSPVKRAAQRKNHQ
jgi:hypothetical protein